MIDNCAKYNLCNPAFTQDIGKNMLGNISGNRIDDLDDFRLSGGQYTSDNINLKNELTNDKFEKANPTTKTDKIKKGIILGAAALAVILVGKKFGGSIKKLLGKIPGVSTIKTKVSGTLSKIKGKIKMPNFKSWGTKIKNIFK